MVLELHVCNGRAGCAAFVCEKERALTRGHNSDKYYFSSIQYTYSIHGMAYEKHTFTYVIFGAEARLRKTRLRLHISKSTLS